MTGYNGGVVVARGKSEGETCGSLGSSCLPHSCPDGRSTECKEAPCDLILISYVLHQINLGTNYK